MNEGQGSSGGSRGSDTKKAGAGAGDDFGRHKAPPASRPEMKKDSMPTFEIKQYAFQTTLRIAEPALTAEKQNELNRMILEKKDSRQGRDGQRWLEEPTTGEKIRLVTGCIPILADGRVLLVQSSRKNEWILPKGGWEQDETMEQSASRETYEEAGVLGILGPTLTEIKYETRKSKKRKLDSRSSTPAPESLDDPTTSNSDHKNKDNSSTENKEKNTDLMEMSEERIRPQQQTYTFVQMTLFVLYVSDVRDEWPEHSRLRRAMHIDEALEVMQSRPEFREKLEEVKEKGLHIVRTANGVNAHTTTRPSKLS